MPYRDPEKRKAYQREYNKTHKPAPSKYIPHARAEKNICRYCKEPITEENKYSVTVCKKCVRVHLVVCNDDCFNCVYDDCRVEALKLKDEPETVQYRVNKMRAV